MSYHARLQVMLEISLEGKDEWIAENRKEKNQITEHKEGNYLKMAETEGKNQPFIVATELLKFALQLFKCTSTQTLLILNYNLYQKHSLF